MPPGVGRWRVAAIARMTPRAPIATTRAAISTARGGPSESAIASPSALPVAWVASSARCLHSPKSAVTNLPCSQTADRRGGGVGSGESDRTIGELGEFWVIGRLTRGRPQSADVALGPGDDGAVVLAADGRVVVSTDMLVEGRHFRLDWSTPHDVGRKAVAQNAADIEAMGARVTALVVGFGAPPETPVAQVSALADGMWDEAGRIGAVIVGGDLVSSPQWGGLMTVLGGMAGRRP